MEDILFYIPVIVIPILVVLISVYLLAFYGHPDDEKTAYFPKFLVVCSLTMSHIIVLFIPLDISSDFNAMDFWIITLSIAMTMIFVFIPIAILYYEED